MLQSQELDETARVYAEFVRSFEAEQFTPEQGLKTFVKGTGKSHNNVD